MPPWDARSRKLSDAPRAGNPETGAPIPKLNLITKTKLTMFDKILAFIASYITRYAAGALASGSVIYEIAPQESAGASAALGTLISFLVLVIGRWAKLKAMGLLKKRGAPLPPPAAL